MMARTYRAALIGCSRMGAFIDNEVVGSPDIISIVRQPEYRAEIAIYAAERGVKALYCEKAMCASLADADAMVEVVERNEVAFALGTNMRWHPGFNTMRNVINSGDLGELHSIVIYTNGSLFNESSHIFGLVQSLNNDVPVTWVQGHLLRGDQIIVGDELEMIR